MPQRREDGRNLPENELDETLAARFGSYASYATRNDPIRTDFHGDSPAVEVDRLLDLYATPDADVLDLGCGAGFSLCRAARTARSVWGIDLQSDLLKAATHRVSQDGLSNVRLIAGDTCHGPTLDQLPDRHFSFAFSRRGPFMTQELAKKLTPDAIFVVELAQDFLGLKELFGRTPFLPKSSGDSDVAITAQAGAGFVPVSAKSYWYEEYFQDAEHLARYLRQGAPLQNWWMEACPYDEARDRPALDLYVRYNTTPLGIRLVGHRRVYVFRRQETQFYPVVGQ